MSTVEEIRESAFKKLDEYLEKSSTLRETWHATTWHLYYKGYNTAKEELTPQWIDIDLDPPADKEMVVFRGYNIQQGSTNNYTTDPYCGWIQGDEFKRWPHPFPPTHYMKLPS